LKNLLHSKENEKADLLSLNQMKNQPFNWRITSLLKNLLFPKENEKVDLLSLNQMKNHPLNWRINSILKNLLFPKEDEKEGQNVYTLLLNGNVMLHHLRHHLFVDALLS
jgi:hypothetical protein